MSLGPSRSRAPTEENRWQLAFAIVMLLLFALFLILYSVSKKDSVRLAEQLETLRNERLKPVTVRETAPVDESGGGARNSLSANAALQEEILSEAKSFLASGPDGARTKEQTGVEVLDLASGDFLVRVATPDLFQSGSPRVSPEARPFVDRLGEMIVRSGRRLRIEGHADFDDSEAIQRSGSPYSNTWELSAARSAALAQYWMRKFDLDPMKIEAAAFGKYRPLEKKTGRPAQANRRIEIVILRMEK